MQHGSVTKPEIEIEAKVIRNGQVIHLGVISSPYEGRLRNWMWKKRKSRKIRRLLSKGK